MTTAKVSETELENASPAATSYVELETAAGVSEHALLSAIRTLFKTTYDTLYQPLDAELTSLAGASANGVSLVTAANYAAMLTLLGAITASSTDTLTNKTFNADGTGNSISNIENADIKAAAAIALNKLAALTASELVVTDANGFLTNATGVSATEAGYLNGVTSAIQTQLDLKAPLASPTFTGTVTIPKTTEIQDTSADHQYVLAVNELTADRTVTLPLLTGNDEFVFAAHTKTLTNKRVTPRTDSTTSSATPTINTDNVDFYHLTAQTADITSFTTNLSGTPTTDQRLHIAVTGTAARAITWGTSFEAGAVSLPTTTVTTQRLDVLFIWNAVTSKWRCMASGSA